MGPGRMNLKELLGGGGILLGAMTLIQLSPLKINPWSTLWGWLKKGFRAVCRATNAEVLSELGEVRSELGEVREEIGTTKNQLTEHVTMDDRRTADSSRARILHFNLDTPRKSLWRFWPRLTLTSGTAKSTRTTQTTGRC